MTEDIIPQGASTSANKVRKLSQEIRGLRGKFEEIKREVYEKKKKILEKEDTFREKHPVLTHPVGTARIGTKRVIGEAREIKERVNPSSGGPYFLLTKIRKDSTWELHGTYDTAQERDNAINEIKTSIRSRKGIYSEYYATTNLKEVHRFLKVSKYREQKKHEELKREISRLPTGRWSENIKTGTQVQEPKQISKTVAEYGERPSTMPRMAISAYGSMRPPKRTTLPSYGAQGRTRQSGKKFVKTIVPHDQYVEMLNEGYTRDQLESHGIVDKYSRYYQDESVFGKGVVAYKPISMYQAFVKPNPPKTIYQRRQETGLPYETFKPFSVGTPDEFGERKTNFKPKRIYL